MLITEIVLISTLLCEQNMMIVFSERLEANWIHIKILASLSRIISIKSDEKLLQSD